MKDKLSSVANTLKNNVLSLSLSIILVGGGAAVFAATNNDSTDTGTTVEVSSEIITEEETTTVAETVSEAETTTTAPVAEAVAEAPTIAPTKAIVNTVDTSNYTYQLVSGNNVYITGYYGDESNITIPTSINGYNVTGIADDFNGVFALNKSITSVTFPEGIIYIGSCAFRSCTNLEYVSFPSTLQIIKNGAFSGCELLVKSHNYIIPSTIKYVDSTAFQTFEVEMISTEQQTVIVK